VYIEDRGDNLVLLSHSLTDNKKFGINPGRTPFSYSFPVNFIKIAPNRYRQNTFSPGTSEYVWNPQAGTLTFDTSIESAALELQRIPTFVPTLFRRVGNPGPKHWDYALQLQDYDHEFNEPRKFYDFFWNYYGTNRSPGFTVRSKELLPDINPYNIDKTQMQRSFGAQTKREYDDAYIKMRDQGICYDFNVRKWIYWPHCWVLENALSTTGDSSTINVYHKGHCLKDGEVINLCNACKLGNTPASQLNDDHTISVVDKDNYEFTVGTSTGGAVSSTDKIVVSQLDGSQQSALRGIVNQNRSNYLAFVVDMQENKDEWARIMPGEEVTLSGTGTRLDGFPMRVLTDGYHTGPRPDRCFVPDLQGDCWSYYSLRLPLLVVDDGDPDCQNHLIRTHWDNSARSATWSVTTKNGSSRVIVAHTNHGFKDGECITVRNWPGTWAGIPAGDFNTDHVVVCLDKDSYYLDLDTSATSDSISTPTPVTVDILLKVPAGHWYMTDLLYWINDNAPWLFCYFAFGITTKLTFLGNVGASLNGPDADAPSTLFGGCGWDIGHLFTSNTMVEDEGLIVETSDDEPFRYKPHTPLTSSEAQDLLDNIESVQVHVKHGPICNDMKYSAYCACLAELKTRASTEDHTVFGPWARGAEGGQFEIWPTFDRLIPRLNQVELDTNVQYFLSPGPQDSGAAANVPDLTRVGLRVTGTGHPGEFSEYYSPGGYKSNARDFNRGIYRLEWDLALDKLYYEDGQMLTTPSGTYDIGNREVDIPAVNYLEDPKWLVSRPVAVKVACTSNGARTDADVGTTYHIIDVKQQGDGSNPEKTWIYTALGRAAVKDSFQYDVYHEGNVPDPEPGTSGFEFEVINQGSGSIPLTAPVGSESHRVIMTSADATTLGGKYFIIYDKDDSVAVWYDLDGGSSEPAHGAARSIEVDIVTGDATADVVAKTSNAIEADAEFHLVGGIDLGGAYFTLHDSSGSVAVWYSIDGESVPEPNHGAARSLEVELELADSHGEIAAKTAAVLDADSEFTIENVATGPGADPVGATDYFFDPYATHENLFATRRDRKPAGGPATAYNRFGSVNVDAVAGDYVVGILRDDVVERKFCEDGLTGLPPKYGYVSHAISQFGRKGDMDKWEWFDEEADNLSTFGSGTQAAALAWARIFEWFNAEGVTNVIVDQRNTIGGGSPFWVMMARLSGGDRQFNHNNSDNMSNLDPTGVLCVRDDMSMTKYCEDQGWITYKYLTDFRACNPSDFMSIVDQGFPENGFFNANGGGEGLYPSVNNMDSKRILWFSNATTISATQNAYCAVKSTSKDTSLFDGDFGDGTKFIGYGCYYRPFSTGGNYNSFINWYSVGRNGEEDIKVPLLWHADRWEWGRVVYYQGEEGSQVMKGLDQDFSELHKTHYKWDMNADIFFQDIGYVKDAADPLCIAVLDASTGPRADAVDGTEGSGTGFSISTDRDGMDAEDDPACKEATKIGVTPNQSAAALNGKYFVLSDDAGTVAFWYDIDNSGTPAPAHGASRGVEISTVNTGDDDKTIAEKTAAAIDADSKFSAHVFSVDPAEHKKPWVYPLHPLADVNFCDQLSYRDSALERACVILDDPDASDHDFKDDGYGNIVSTL
jgi:hypothetical protein